MIDRVAAPGFQPEPTATAAPPKPAAAAPAFAPDARITTTPEPETRVSKPFDFGPESGWLKRKIAKLGLAWEALKTRWSPGEWIARKSEGGKLGIRRIRENERADELRLPFQGVKKADGAWTAPAIPNPGDPAGTFDPYAFLPNIAFHPREDSFPVLPDAEGTGTPDDDVKRYAHGVIGGAQPLKGAVSVARKGEFTVLTYSLFYVDNKAGTYHDKDSSTVSVYLKPDATGKLQPAYMYTSWHYGANMSKWEDVKKGDDGRPVVRVERGSHALRPLAAWERQPKDGVVVAGDGTVKIDGKASPHRLTFVTPQGTSVRNAEPFEPGDPRQKSRMDTYFRIYQERTNPVHPSLFGY